MSRKDDKGSRFDGFLKAARAPKQNDENLDVQAPKHSDVQTSEHQNIQTSKSKDPNYQRTTIYIPKAMHRKLKAIAAEEEREISNIVETLIQEWIEKRKQNLDV